MKLKVTGLIFLFFVGLSAELFAQQDHENKWSHEKAKEWYEEQGKILGANFVPSTAINQLEMWQEDTFDPETIERELGYAQEIGMNTMRVFLHSLAYKADRKKE